MLLGVEGDATWSGAERSSKQTDGTDVYTLKVGVPWVASVRGRVGLVSDSWLFFATAGLAFGELKMDVTMPGSPLKLGLSKSDTGYIIGGGIEKQFNQRFSGRAEVLRYGFSDVVLTSGAPKTDLDFTVLRAGLSLHLN
jgi:outer membrane immunogenic protein